MRIVNLIEAPASIIKRKREHIKKTQKQRVVYGKKTMSLDSPECGCQRNEFNNNEIDRTGTTAEQTLRIKRSEIGRDITDTTLYVGMDAKQQPELNKLAPYIHAASVSDKEHELGDEDTTAGWDFSHRSATAATSSSSDYISTHTIPILLSFDENMRSKHDEEWKQATDSKSQSLRKHRVAENIGEESISSNYVIGTRWIYPIKPDGWLFKAKMALFKDFATS